MEGSRFVLLTGRSLRDIIKEDQLWGGGFWHTWERILVEMCKGFKWENVKLEGPTAPPRALGEPKDMTKCMTCSKNVTVLWELRRLR
jgi:hypothetical protein